MSEYQRLKARALEQQREKDAELRRELAAKAKREAQATKEAEERRKRIDAASKEARRRELMAANAALTQGTSNAPAKIAYDPFAEDPRPGPSRIVPKKLASKPSSKPASSGGVANGRATADRAKTARPRERKESPPPLGRKARALQSLKRESKADSMFSVQSLVAAHESPRASPGPGRSISPRKPVSSGGSTSRSKPAPPKRGGMAGMKQSIDVTGLRKLCPDRDTRDRRTIDEIQRDIRARNGNGQTTRDRRYESSSDSDSPPPRKKTRGSPPLSGEPDRATVSAMIQGIFGRGRAARAYDDDSDVSDMEAGLDDVLREERRAAAIARREDEEAEREEAAHRAAKEKARRERMRKA